MCGNGICQKCGVNPVRQKPNGEKGATQKYCLMCRNASGRVIRRIDRSLIRGKCECCGKPIVGHKRRFCNGECGYTFRYHSRRAAEKPCSECGELFNGTCDVGKCNSCRNRTIEDCACNWCGDMFRPRQSAHSSYCSHTCSARGTAQNKMLRRIANALSLGHFIKVVGPFPHTCGQCGKEWESERRGVSDYCSSYCASVATGRMLGDDAVRKCVDCGCEFTKFNQKKAPMGKRCKPCQDAYTKRYRKLHKGKGGKTHVQRAKKAGVAYSYFDHKARVFRPQGYICQRCGVQTYWALPTDDPLHPELDHVIPLSKGGPHLPWNCQTLCRACNAHKGDLLPQDVPSCAKGIF